MLKRARLTSFRASGDTIVEVMVVLAILGLALAISYATANRSLLNARQAQENSTATELAQSQIEAIYGLASAGNNQLFNQTSVFCIQPLNTISTDYTATGPCPNFNNSTSFAYTVKIYNCDKINPTPTQCSTVILGSNTFIVEVTWPDVLGEGNDTVTLAYRIHQPVAAD